MANQSRQTVLHLLPSLVKSAQALARPPISNYHVGAVGVGSSGRIFFGFLAVSAAPCGHCRQFLQELRAAPDVNILITATEKEKENKTINNRNDKDMQFAPLSYFLPHRFGPDDLLEKDVPLLLEPHRNGLSFCSDIRNGEINGDGDDSKYAALEAANASHAPYSGCPSGVALVDVEGKIYKGSYMESAAYNPSLPPVQAALVAYVASCGGGGYERIVTAVLVEKADAVIKQEHTAKLLLQCISPKCEFKTDLWTGLASRIACRPPPAYIKCNMDAATDAGHRTTSCVAALYDEHNTFLKTFYGNHFALLNPCLAEALSVFEEHFHGLRLKVWKPFFSKIIVWKCSML
ncbi:hypothetical protein Gotur_022483 [Gossypium turneri]